MGFLPIKGALILNRTVPAPIPDRGESVCTDMFRGRPAVQKDRLQGFEPGQPTAGYWTIRVSDPLANRDKMSVPAKTHIDSLDSAPKLVKGGIQVEIGPDCYPRKEVLVGEQAGNVDEHVGSHSHF